MNKRQLNDFLGFILNRGISGIVNGIFYATGWGIAIKIALGIFTIISLLYLIPSGIYGWNHLKGYEKALWILSIIVNVASIIGLGMSFKMPNWKFSDIHLYTQLNQMSISSAKFATGTKIWLLLLTTSPSSFFQKIFVNIITFKSWKKWNYKGTDDISGKTWGLKLFPNIKVPRIASGNMYFRLGATIISIIAFSILSNKYQKNNKHINIIINTGHYEINK